MQAAWAGGASGADSASRTGELSTAPRIPRVGCGSHQRATYTFQSTLFLKVPAVGLCLPVFMLLQHVQGYHCQIYFTTHIAYASGQNLHLNAQPCSHFLF